MAFNPELESATVPERGRKYFTVSEANRALPYVSRVVRDIRETYREALAIQHRLELPSGEESGEVLQDQYDDLVERLNGYVDELREAGVELKDYELGLVDFPAIYQGRVIYLCWRRGEPRLAAWHEVDAGFPGRQDIAHLDDENR